MAEAEKLGTGTERLTETAGELASTQPLDLRRRARPVEDIIQGLLFFCGFVSIFTTLGIVYVLISESLHFFEKVSVFEFLGTYKWQPVIGEFGIWPLVNSTLMVSLIAMLVAIPLGLGAAIYLSEYASTRARNILKPILEVLAGIPTVVYGFFAITFMTPLLQSIVTPITKPVLEGIYNSPLIASTSLLSWIPSALQGVFGRGDVQIYNVASAGIVVGILLLPLVASMSEDAFSAVPSSLRQASYGLGATRFETAVRVVLPGALSGVIAALIVAVSRAVGETMVVAIAAGAGPSYTFNPFQAAETMTGHIARISSGDLSYQTIDYQSLFAIGLTLFLMTLALNIISREVVKRFREVYD